MEKKENTPPTVIKLFKSQILKAIKKGCEKQTGNKNLIGCLIYLKENESTVKAIEENGNAIVFEKKINNIDFLTNMIKKQYDDFERLENIEIVANFTAKTIKIKYDYYLLLNPEKKTNSILI